MKKTTQAVSLNKSRENYRYNYTHFEPIGMQDRLIDEELPTHEWIVEFLKVGYALILNANKQPKAERDGADSKVASQASKKSSKFLQSALWSTIKILGLVEFLKLIWIFLTHLSSIILIFKLVLFDWKGAPPTEDKMEIILKTPLWEALATEFREKGVIGLRAALDGFIYEKEKEARNAELQQAEQQNQGQKLDPSAANDIAIEQAKKRFEKGPSPNHLPQYYFTEIEQFRELFTYLEVPAIADSFQDDEMFAYMRVAGPNPVWLELVKENDHIFNKFPVTNEHYQGVMGDQDSLERAISERRVYAVDYALLDGALEGAFGSTPEQQKHLYAAMALFAVPDSSHEERFLKPIAIQCGQKNSNQCGQKKGHHCILTPACAKKQPWLWLAAKTAVQIADSTVHEAITHLARTHLLIEPFVVATHRQLPGNHPVYRLLHPHFEGTILINFGAWKILTAPEQGVNGLLAPTIDQSRALAIKGLQMRGFNEDMLPQRIAARGVGDREALPVYPYRDDGLAIWNAIHDWVDSYIHTYYQSDDEVAGDAALQNWGAELVSFDGGRVKDFGSDGEGQGEIATIKYLVDALTMIIFTGSAQHAAVNFPQLGIMSFPPAMPTTGYLPAEKFSDFKAEADYCQMLPPKDAARQALLLLHILGGVYYTRLGNYPSDFFEDSLKDAEQAFQKALKDIDHQINERNNELPGKFNYTYLKSEKIPQSINI